MKRIAVGILAHVDAGKTTLIEGLLYTAGQIKQPGRVDHRDTVLDCDTIERERGITIFSKQAQITTADAAITLLDTPGHVDFSAEMERTLQVLDYAVLVISAPAGVQAHTRTVWKLLQRYAIPTFVFVTKMDLPGVDRHALLRQLQAHLSGSCVDFGAPDRDESIALCDEAVMEAYLETGEITREQITRLIAERACFACYFGSGLRLKGIDALLRGLLEYTAARPAGEAFAASVFKLSRDHQNNLMTFLKLTGGELRVRDQITYGDPPVTEKVSQIRIYTGKKYQTAERVLPGTVCAVLGLSAARPGMGLGAQPDAPRAQLQPVLRYRVGLPAQTDPQTAFSKLTQLAQEDPLLNIVWEPSLRQIELELMGPVQIELLRQKIAERFEFDVTLDAGRILYKETITAPVEGVGHYEPLRHYAEVHLLLSPLPRGSGLVLDADCPDEVLAPDEQRLILAMLAQKRHLGVLTGAPVTDLRITLRAGRTHIKHTEGGDLRQAACRAVRQGLMQAQSRLLEPYYAFELAVPADQLGRAISDVQQMSGSFDPPQQGGDLTVLTGRAPVAAMREYAQTVAMYTRGQGRLFCRVDGYDVCHNEKAVIEAAGYDPTRDLDNPPDSIFCAHGAGVFVRWDEVSAHMHVPSILPKPPRTDDAPPPKPRRPQLDERELERIMEREFGPIRRPQYTPARPAAQVREQTLAAPKRQRWLVIDGYNVIHAWQELAPIAQDDLELARRELLEILVNYQSFIDSELVVVFDAYRVRHGAGAHEQTAGVRVVYTKQGQTGDQYIERLVREIGKNEYVRVVTSDAMIQVSALRSGVQRVSAREFHDEVAAAHACMEKLLRRLREQAQLKNKIDIPKERQP